MDQIGIYELVRMGIRQYQCKIIQDAIIQTRIVKFLGIQLAECSIVEGPVSQKC